MSWYENMQSRLNANGGSISNAYVNSTRQVLINNFKNFPSYKTVLINGELIDTRILDGKDSQNKIMYLLPDQIIRVGDFVEYNSNYWLIFDFIESEIYPKADIKRCNGKIRWQDNDGFIYEENCIATQSLLTKMDVKEDNRGKVRLLEGEVNVYVSQNINTGKINIDQKFYVGKHIYKVTGIDDITDESIIKFVMKITTIGVDDNETLRICDYKGNIKLNITNNYNKLITSEQLQLTHEFKLNDTIVKPDYSITYHSSNPDVATVDENGLITALTAGEVIFAITAKADNNPTLSDSINITIEDGLSDFHIIEILGSDYIDNGLTSKYTAVVKNNNTIINKPIVWSITNETGVGVIIDSNKTECTVKNNKSGKIALNVALSENSDVKASKEIILLSLW